MKLTFVTNDGTDQVLLCGKWSDLDCCLTESVRRWWCAECSLRCRTYFPVCCPVASSRKPLECWRWSRAIKLRRYWTILHCVFKFFLIIRGENHFGQWSFGKTYFDGFQRKLRIMRSLCHLIISIHYSKMLFWGNVIGGWFSFDSHVKIMIIHITFPYPAEILDQCYQSRIIGNTF